MSDPTLPPEEPGASGAPDTPGTPSAAGTPSGPGGPGGEAQPLNPYAAPTYPAPGATPTYPAAGAPPSYTAPPYAGGPASTPPGQKYNVLAIVSLIAAFFVSVAAVITGHIALYQIKRTGEKGRGLAIGGLVLGYLGIVAGIIGVIVLIIAFVAGVSKAADDGTFDADPYSSTPFDGSTDGTSPVAPAGDLTFVAGQSLDSSSLPQFGDGFIVDPDWSVASPDDGNGNWSYTSKDGLCTAKFHQGALASSVTVVAGDDRATTDNYLEYVDNATAADVSQYAIDDSINYQYADSADQVETRSLVGQDSDGTNWITNARAFTQTQSGMYIDLTCQPSADLKTVYSDVLSKASILVF